MKKEQIVESCIEKPNLIIHCLYCFPQYLTKKKVYSLGSTLIVKQRKYIVYLYSKYILFRQSLEKATF